MAKAPKQEVSDTKNEAQESTWQGAFRAYGTAFDRIKANPEPAFLIVGTYAALAIISGILQGGKPYMDSTYANIEDLAYLVFVLALVTYSLAVADGKKITISEVMRFSLRKYVWILLAVFLYVLIVGASLLLLIIPAIWTIAWFYFQVYAVVDKNLGPIKALKESKRLAKQHKGKVWGVIGVGILISIPAGLTAYLPFIGGVGSAAAGVWTISAGAILYRWLQQNAEQHSKGE